MFLRDDRNPNTYWFSALGEVKGTLNGAPEESFCGFSTTTHSSVSDLVNSDFVPEREIRAMTEHENIVFIFSERSGYSVIGQLNLLDDRATRSLLKLYQFNEGCAGPKAILSTPYGLLWESNGKRMYLWGGGQEIFDVGEPVQTALTSIPNDLVSNSHLSYWSGNGRQWAMLSTKLNMPDDNIGNPPTYRCLFYDFAIPTQRPNVQGPDPGTWYEWADMNTTCSATYWDDDGVPFLLVGDENGIVHQADVICNPAHLDYSFILGHTYLGSSVQKTATAVLKSGLLLPAGDTWDVIHYLQFMDGDQNGAGEPLAGTLTQPSIFVFADIENPDRTQYATSTGTLSFGTRLTSGDFRCWMRVESTANIAGMFCKQAVISLSVSGTSDSTGESDGRLTTRARAIYKLALVHSPKKELSL